ncbi:MAG: hypothetical protein K6G27_10220 [Lachnospiraceae bacterium]|nr:hypothetical protein [Lachnospiraceae bacterium]
MNEKEKMSRALNDDDMNSINGGIFIAGIGNDLVYKSKDGKRPKGQNAILKGERPKATLLGGADIDNLDDIPGSKLVSGGSFGSGAC